MADTLPEPLVPAECDLRGMEWMPLYGSRLFGSDFDAHADNGEFRAGLQLWWASWNQVPAASLPDDDTALCKLAGLGKDIRSWRKVKAHAMHGFCRCSDGRFYHRALAAFARESWDRRLKDRSRKLKWREERERRVQRAPLKEKEKIAAVRVPSAFRNGHGDVPSQWDRTADETRRDETRRDATRRDETLVLSHDGRARELPGDWQPGEADMTAVRTARPDLTKPMIDAETETFRNHAKANARTAHNWGANWRNWLLKARQANGAAQETFDQRRIREAREAVR